MSDPIDVVSEALARAGGELHGTSARCPSHEDHRASLSVSVNPDGLVMMFCHAGCDLVDDVLPALGLTMADLRPQRSQRDDVTERYVYVDERARRSSASFAAPGSAFTKSASPAASG